MTLQERWVALRKHLERLPLYLTPAERTVAVFLTLSLLGGFVASRVREFRASSPGVRLIPSVVDSIGRGDSTDLNRESLASRPGLDDVARASAELERRSRSGKAGKAGSKVNINTASKQVLMSLPGVGPVMADRIIAYREIHGEFRSIGEIRNVKGIGPKTFEKIRERLLVTRKAGPGD
jgi:comEA protein